MRPKRSLFRRALRLVWRVFLLIFLFGAIVSVVSVFLAPEVRIAVRPEPGVEVEEVTRLYPVTVARVAVPRTVGEISDAVRASAGPISVGGGRYSMGGQTATPGGVQIDLREFRGVAAYDRAARTITVHSGTRWREVQEAIDADGLAVKIMQSYDTFTVGGALSVNAHGRYIGQGPVVRSVRAITLVLADGSVVTASPAQNPDLFYGAIGGYGAVGVIADVTLDLASNTPVRREDRKMPIAEYGAFFKTEVRDDPSVVFHNGDLYPPAYERVHAVSYRETKDPVTVAARLRPPDQASWTHRAAFSIITGWPGGHWIRERVMEPFLYLGNPVTWRNYEASYDVSELEPASRQRATYVLQEYFVPAEKLDPFVADLRRILRAHDVNAVNVSIRHALPDPGTLLAWAPTEVFAFVLYYRQGTDPAARREVGRWTRELIDAAIRNGGRYYLPYQPVATRRQFEAAYPGASRLFALKRRVDPAGRFTNTLWDLYRTGPDGAVPPVRPDRMPAALPAEVRIALEKRPGYDRDESAEYLTHPEWDLVYSSDAYARWLLANRKPSAFPYIRSVGTFWRSYAGVWRAARARYGFPAGQHVVLGVIGFSTAIEYGFKGLYEATIGRLSELALPPEGTAEDRYAAAVAADYVGLITRRGWYEFDFGAALRKLWSTVPSSGPGKLRKWERRFALTAEFGVKAAYAALISLGTKTVYSADEDRRGILAVGWTDAMKNTASPEPPGGAGPPPEKKAGPLDPLEAAATLDRGYELLTVPRYDPFRDALLALSDRAGTLRLAEICGSELVTFCGTAPGDWAAPPGTSVVVAYAVPTDPTRHRMLLRTSARDLLDVLHGLRREGKFDVEHIYDY